MSSENDSEINVNGQLTKTKAKKSLVVNFDAGQKNKILKEIKNNITLNKSNILKDSNDANYLVEFPDYKSAKEAKEMLTKLLSKFKRVSVVSAFNQKKKALKPVQSDHVKEEKFKPLNGTIGDRSRNLFEIRYPKIIIRNLNFNLKEENFKTEMEKFGQIKSIHLPKKETGKFFGYGFVTYEKMEDAMKAMNELNSRADKFIGTKVAVDWCLPKNIFLKNINETKKEEKADKDEKDEGDENEKNDENERNTEDEEETKSSDEEKEESSSKDKRKATDEKEESLAKKHKTGTLDVQEQRTVFVRNLSFDATEESVSEAFSKFGTVKFVKLCIDKELERPKGTAFIQFETSQGAINACAESEMFEVDTRLLQIDMAVSRAKVNGIVEEKKLAPSKDNRNLALLKEGIIYQNSYEAKNVSKADMLRRQKLEASNNEKLKNLHYFVSPTRLSVHNIPIKCTDQELKQIFLKAIDMDGENLARHSRGGIVECRIMRDLARCNADGVFRSKGFGFVEFSNHELAKKALHATNNISGLFDNGSKLIVQFSIEDMRALKKKQKRAEKSKFKSEKKNLSFDTNKPKAKNNSVPKNKRLNKKKPQNSAKKIDNKKLNGKKIPNKSLNTKNKKKIIKKKF